MFPLLVNVRLGWKALPGKDPLAYSIMTEEIFIPLAPDRTCDRNLYLLPPDPLTHTYTQRNPLKLLGSFVNFHQVPQSKLQAIILESSINIFCIKFPFITSYALTVHCLHSGTLNLTLLYTLCLLYSLVLHASPELFYPLRFRKWLINMK